MRTYVKYAFGAIVLYVLVANATGSGKVLAAGSSGATNLVKAFQGR